MVDITMALDLSDPLSKDPDQRSNPPRFVVVQRNNDVAPEDWPRTCGAWLLKTQGIVEIREQPTTR